MAEVPRGDRKSKAASPELIADDEERARREVENGFRQFDKVLELVDLSRERPFKLRPSTILMLQRAALEGISGFAGTYRPAGVEISGSRHKPVGAHMVAEEIEHMCDYVNEHWEEKSALHLAAYVMWKLNWIHPFDDGNGRTSRAVSYLVLCARSGIRLPGTNTIPDQIAANKQPYYTALEAADVAHQEGHLDLSEIEKLLEDYLAVQLVSVLEQAKGGSVT
jgi:Fic family protein